MGKESKPDPQPSDFSLVNVSQSQVLAVVDSLSNLSEPPDIRNWFSSYTYQSPELNSDFQGCDCVEEVFDGEEKSKGKEENLGEFQKFRNKDGLGLGERAASIGFVKSTNTSEDRDHGIRSASQDTYSVEGNKMISGQLLEGKPTGNHHDDEKSSLAGQVSIVKIGRNNGKSLLKMTRMTDSVEIRKQTCGNNKENDESSLPENGFISTRNERRERLNYDTSLKRSVEFEFDCLRSGVIDSLPVVRKKPLSETTYNIQHSNSSEVTGKWQCPQKRKPNLGRPLRQLRLEQWAHKV